MQWSLCGFMNLNIAGGTASSTFNSLFLTFGVWVDTTSRVHQVSVGSMIPNIVRVLSSSLRRYAVSLTILSVCASPSRCDRYVCRATECILVIQTALITYIDQEIWWQDCTHVHRHHTARVQYHLHCRHKLCMVPSITRDSTSTTSAPRVDLLSRCSC